MSDIKVMNPIGIMALEIIAESNGLPSPEAKGAVVAVEGEDVSHISEVTADIVPEGMLAYFDEGAGRHFVVPVEDTEEVTQ